MMTAKRTSVLIVISSWEDIWKTPTIKVYYIARNAFAGSSLILLKPWHCDKIALRLKHRKWLVINITKKRLWKLECIKVNKMAV